MDWLDTKYIGLISSRLDKFKKKSGNSYNFRCPICGDSKKSKIKARGWIFHRDGSTRFYCHNCTASMSLGGLVKYLDPQLYSEMKLERLKDGAPGFIAPAKLMSIPRPVFEKSEVLRGLTRVSQLHHDDPRKKYIVSRRIPSKFHYKLYVVDEFFAYVNRLIPGKFDKSALAHDDSRLLIPFINKSGKVHALQGRSFDSDSRTKYITIMLDESVPRVYGLDTYDEKKTAYVTEGPIDSMFLENGLATAGGDLASAMRSFDKNSLVIVYDNERRSRETVSKMEKAIRDGYKVCFWPENIVYKDINDMVKSGMRPEYVEMIIDQNSYSGLRAEMELKTWKRVANSEIKKYSMRA
jgi:hypothetical protein